MNSPATEPKAKKSQALKDLIILSAIAAVLFLLEIFTEAFESFEKWARARGLWEAWEINEFIVAFTLLAFLFGIYSWRRWQEIKKEMAERRRTEEKVYREKEFTLGLLKGLSLWFFNFETL